MKKSLSVTLALAAVVACGLLAVASAARGVSQNANSSSTQNSNSNGSMSGLSSQDRKFMMTAAEGGMAEVEMARTAVERAGSDAVKQYARQMIEDHTKANEELMSLAAAKGVTLPTGPDAKHRALMARMSKMSGHDFDMMYVREAGVKDHEKMLKLLQDEIRKGRDADAKAFASKTLPTVQEHHRMAREMSGGMGAAHGNSNSNTNR
jgi:putative membrane protein